MSSSLAIDRIRSISDQINDKLLKKLKNSIIFIDSIFAEWFHLTCGLEALIKIGGAVNIKEFSSFQNGNDHPKGIFFISRLFDNNQINMGILEDIIKSSKFQYVILILNETNDNFNNDDLIDKLKDDILMWMRNANYTCEIFIEKIPFLCLPSSKQQNKSSQIINFLNPLCSNIIINTTNYQLINFDTYLKLVKQDIIDLTQQTQSTHHYSSLLTSPNSNKDQISTYYQILNKTNINEIKCLANSLNLMLDYLDSKDDCYSLGVLSKIVSHELNMLQTSKQRRKNATNKVSLLLIDRNLDLTTPALYHDETVFDKMNNILENLNDTSNDIKFNLYEFLFENKNKKAPNGTFFHSTDDICEYLIEQILLTKPKDCLLEIYRKFNEVFPNSAQHDTTNKKQLSNRISRITVETIKTQLKNQLKIKPESLHDHLNFIQIIVSYCLACDNQLKDEMKFDNLISYIKVQTQKLFHKDDASILSQLYQLFNDDFEKDYENRKYKIFDLLTILCYIYSLIGEECFYGIEEENRMKKLVSKEIKQLIANKKLNNETEFVQKYLINEKSIEQFIEKYFDHLKSIKILRSHFKQFNQLLFSSQENHEKQVSATFKPLIKQICEYLLKTSIETTNEPLVDIELRTVTEGIKDLFKLKLGSYLGSQSRNHPLNNEFLIIYIIGGITTYEMKLVKELFSKTDYKVLIGSSQIFNHKKLIKYLSV